MLTDVVGRIDFLKEEIERFARRLIVPSQSERSTAHAAISTGGGN